MTLTKSGTPWFRFFVHLLPFFLVACQPLAPKTAQNEEPDVRRKLDYLNQRLNKIEGDLSKVSRTVGDAERLGRQTKADQSVLIEDLRVEVQGLRGTIEVLQHDFNESRESHKRIQQDIDARLAELEGRVSRTHDSGSPKEQSSGDSKERTGRASDVNAITRYNQILRVILDRKDYDTAITQFEDFLKTYPQSSLSANAQYWVGEGYFAKGNFRKAIGEFQKVVDRHPQSEKVCDSILKQGFAFAELKDHSNAKLFLTEVTQRCPKSQPASRAQARLRDLAGSPSTQ